ncbi:hypothetical protein D0T11_20400 [Hymenobacter rubripertinctus]|uniref:Resolvase/invertase-type recombinase catalytic domain-containing protein n=1 Tax=Hymenobacter rubripertinctus TaxID=2029981 RepID=A0A418QK32_9BACT|nr:hypothetical protein D0T11_20400 [Hymenobacter rubripertinctus]
MFQKKVSRATRAWSALDKLLTSLRKGYMLYIYKVNRLGHHIKHSLDMVAELEFKGVGFVSLNDTIAA